MKETNTKFQSLCIFVLFIFLFNRTTSFFVFESHFHRKNIRRTLALKPGLVSSQLSLISSDNNMCLLKNGINKASFLTCCGDKYSVFIQNYIKGFTWLVDNLQNDFKENLKDICTRVSDECEGFHKQMREKVLESQYNYNALKLIGVNFQISNKLPKNEFLTILKGYLDEYVLVSDARVEFRKRLTDDIHKVQNYIETSGIAVDFEYSKIDDSITPDLIRYEPDTSEAEELFINTDNKSNRKKAQKNEYIGVNQKGQSIKVKHHEHQSINSQLLSLLEEEKKEKVKSISNKNSNSTLIGKYFKKNIKTSLKSDQQRFYRNLFVQAADLEKINFYISSGRVDSSLIDLSDLPSDIMETIKRKNLLKNQSL